MRVTIDIDERFARVLSITVCRSHVLENCTSVTCVDLAEGQYLRLDNNGCWEQRTEPPKEEV